MNTTMYDYNTEILTNNKDVIVHIHKERNEKATLQYFKKPPRVNKEGNRSHSSNLTRAVCVCVCV